MPVYIWTKKVKNASQFSVEGYRVIDCTDEESKS